jgi:hypothetical protein
MPTQAADATHQRQSAQLAEKERRLDERTADLDARTEKLRSRVTLLREKEKASEEKKHREEAALREWEEGLRQRERALTEREQAMATFVAPRAPSPRETAKIRELEQRLADHGRERAALLQRIEQLQQPRAPPQRRPPSPKVSPVKKPAEQPGTGFFGAESTLMYSGEALRAATSFSSAVATPATTAPQQAPAILPGPTTQEKVRVLLDGLAQARVSGQARLERLKAAIASARRAGKQVTKLEEQARGLETELSVITANNEEEERVLAQSFYLKSDERLEVLYRKISER